MTPDSFFGTSLRRDPNQPADLSARIDAQLRERLEEAVDFVCLDALVQRRRALALPPPSADNTRDREEFAQSVLAFLTALQAAIAPDLDEPQRQKVTAAERAAASLASASSSLVFSVGLAARTVSNPPSGNDVARRSRSPVSSWYSTRSTGFIGDTSPTL